VGEIGLNSAVAIGSVNAKGHQEKHKEQKK
jgi:hypothetical protein